jgi:hypothetical protein
LAGTGGIGRAAISSSEPKICEDEDCRVLGLLAVLASESVLVEEAAVLASVLLERRRLKGFKA